MKRLGDGVRQKELATALAIEGPSLVRLLDNLERRGLIERREDESDRRARGIHLTALGRELAARVSRVSGEIQERLLANVTDDDLAACHRVLEAVEQVLGETGEAAAPRGAQRQSAAD